MKRSAGQEGAVNILFFVFALILALAGWAMWFTEYKNHEQAQKDKAVAEDEVIDAKGKLVEYKRGVDRVTEVLGVAELGEPTGLDANSESAWVKNQIEPTVATIRKVIDEGRTLFEGGESVNVVTKLLDPAQAKIEALQGEITNLKRDLASAKNDKANAEAAADKMIETNAAALQAKTTEMGEAKNRAATQIKQADDGLLEAQGQITTLTERLEKQLAETQAEITKLMDTKNELERDVRQWKTTLRHVRESQTPDGKIIEVDNRSGLCWINLGSKDQVRRGTRFRTYGLKKGGVREYHGFVVVQRIEATRSLCAVEDGATPQNGDSVTNPYYDPDRQRNFYFLGKLPGRFDNQRAAAILRDFGAGVADEFSVNVDFLVLGDNPDPEAEVGEDADLNWFKSTPEYTDATRWGIEVLRARDLEDFLKY